MKLKGYEIDKLIYEGKDTLTYRAYSKAKKQNVILKTIPSERVTLRNIERVNNEYKLSQKVNYVKGLQNTYALEDWEGRPVLVKEYFKGNSLKKLIKNNDVDLNQFFKIAIQIVDILGEIHKNGIVHLDINPNNILINDDGEIKIIDFSTSIFMIENNEKKTDPGKLEGTFQYISPEQTGRIGRDIDYRSDYYSLGVCFYQLLTGEVPFNNDDKLELIYAHIAKEAVPPVEVNENIPKVISDIVMKLIAKMPEDRYQTLIGLKKDLEICQNSLKTKRVIQEFQIAKQDITDELQIPEKLYGREKELQQLLNSVKKVSSGGKELLLVKGYSGVGKTALVNEIQNYIIKKSAYFVSGKFEQIQSEVPYNAIVQALSKFINKLLMESSNQLLMWREKILHAVGNNGKVITDVIPSLELIIGKQKPVPRLGPSETQNRFNLVFENFIRVIAQKEHIFIMFIDDLQWADAASLNFIKMLMNNEAIGNLLIIGAYRDNEVGEDHPVKIIEDELIKDKASINILQLKPLKEDDVKELLEEALTSLREDTILFNELSQYIYNKTQGNCFFMREFLKVLYDKKYVWFDYNLMHWCWNTEQIKKMDITQNVVDLLIQKIKTLDTSTLEELKNAACIGNKFDLKTIALINDKPLDIVQQELQIAVKKGLIAINKDDSKELSEDNIRFRFLHDRIQQAVYTLIPEEFKPSAHLKIGKLLLKRYLESEKTESLFEVVEQLNLGKSIIIDEEKRIKLADLNLKVGIASKNSSAYKTAFNYLKIGIEMLDSNAWEKHYELTLQLYSEATEMAYLTGDFEKMDQYAQIVLDNAKTIVDKVNVYNVKLQAYQAQFKIQEALNMSISVLKEMGIDVPRKPSEEDVNNAFAKVKIAMEGMKVEDLAKLPPMKDEIMLAAMQILSGSVSVTYKTAPMLAPIVVCKMMELSIKHGNAPFTPAAYASYGMILCGMGIQIDFAYELGNISCRLVENENLKQYKPMVLSIYATAIQQWKEHVSATLKYNEEAYWLGIENGDFEYAAYGAMFYVKHAFYGGKPLEILEKDVKTNLVRVQRIKQSLCESWIRVFGQFVLNMQGKSNEPSKLVGELCDENEIIASTIESGDIARMVVTFISKMTLSYYFQRYDDAIEFSRKAEEVLIGIAGGIDVAIYYYFDSLVKLAIYNDVSDEEKEEILTRVSENQVKMKKWAEDAPMNFLHKFYLVEAERLRVIGKTEEAIGYYNKAISLAKENKYINDEALANELATKFWLNKGEYRYAKLHFKEAYFAYKRWGAEAKVKDLQNKYLEIFHEKFEGNVGEKQTTITTLELVDIAAIVKASQAISQEIVLDDLIKTLIKIVVQNVGAEKIVFILKELDKLIIKGEKENQQEKIIVGLEKSVEGYEQLPKSIINYVSRTSRSVILENSVDSAEFAQDEYIIKNKPKSILCYPLINQREFKGMIYLENNLIKGAFTKDRLKILEILSAQIVIALENAKLYEELEHSNEVLDTKVKERTLELKEERDKLQKYLDIAEVSIWVLDENGIVTLVNRKGCEILGYTEEEMAGRQWSDFIVQNTDKEEVKDFQTIISGELVRYSDKVVLTKTGEKRMMSCYHVILKDKDGNVEGILGCGVDVTEYNLMREQLEYNKLKLEFLANLSHELKTPLNLSFCALQMLNLYLKNSLTSEANEKFEKYSSIIKQNNYRLLKLVNNIVDITKINCDSFEINLHNNDIVELIRDITYSVLEYVKNKNRVLEFKSDIESKVMACDAFNIERIMLNLLSNAIKFTDDGDKISVNVYDRGDSVDIVVRDEGVGIPKDKQKFIFERFRQVDKSFTRNSEGSGIGLTIVKLLVELHNGDIKVESQEGEFTEFIINLPAKKLDSKSAAVSNYHNSGVDLIDRIDIEFSDIYGL
ncbi:AAA family ATPase [Clostridium brassicae]|uniref:histidine kinase n=1 Tax=Clostridium brassicae TaxID=2999072 RepID=A0ABT4DAE0_9CLOT|nr:AAA family ATPase [Clostridium brassicae]MCY6959272.1 AAA family ATPase [Clostridium brassicae]